MIHFLHMSEVCEALAQTGCNQHSLLLRFCHHIAQALNSALSLTDV